MRRERRASTRAVRAAVTSICNRSHSQPNSQRSSSSRYRCPCRSPKAHAYTCAFTVPSMLPDPRARCAAGVDRAEAYASAGRMERSSAGSPSAMAAAHIRPDKTPARRMASVPVVSSGWRSAQTSGPLGFPRPSRSPSLRAMPSGSSAGTATFCSTGSCQRDGGGLLRPRRAAAGAERYDSLPTTAAHSGQTADPSAKVLHPARASTAWPSSTPRPGFRAPRRRRT